MTGLIEPQFNSKGKLTLTPAALIFSTGNVKSEIRRDRIIAVSVGDERVEKGGMPARVGRDLIPFGGGLGVAAVANKSVDLLTIEFRDERAAYHGAVFILPATQASPIKQQLDATIKVPPVADPAPCTDRTTHPNTLLIEPIGSNGVVLPAEYRILFYERLTEELEKLREDDWLYRFGDIDAGAGCTALTLSFSVNDFKRGNEALRASTGFVGYFLGATSAKFHIKLTDRSGKILEEKDLKQKKGGEVESLDLAREVAGQVSDHVKKASRSKS